MNHQLLTGKTALITGAGRNIGRSIALEMARQGADIYFSDIDRERLTGLEKELSEFSITTKGFLSDITNTGDTDTLCDFLTQQRISIDVLCNNVGIEPTAADDHLNMAQWHTVFNTNVFGPMYLTDRVSKLMIANHTAGVVIFTTSIHQWVVRRIPCYSASKAALNMVIKELALELAPHNIRVNGIAPGYVEEDSHGNTIRHQYTPLYNRSIHPRFIGRAAVYLASEYFSRYTTGSVITVDAGLSLYNHLVDQIPLR